jgi:hypothetical protein
MYRDNSLLNRPTNSLQPLWRYLSYSRLIELLSTEVLYFRRLSLMDDKWEGLLTEKTRNQIFKHFYAQYQSVDAANYQIEDYEKHRHEFYINCWHMNDSESYLMWKVYADRGCAIETTFERLQIAFDDFPGEVEGTMMEYLISGAMKCQLEIFTTRRLGKVFPIEMKKSSGSYSGDMHWRTIQYPLMMESR